MGSAGEAALLEIEALSEAERVAWRELSDVALEPNPFFDPDFVEPAHKHLSDGEASLLVVRDGPRWDGCMPVRRGRGWHRLPLAGIFTWKHPYCYLGAPLLRPARAAEALAEMLRAALEDSPLLGLDLFPAEGPVAELLVADRQAAMLREVCLDRFERAVLRRPEGDAELGIAPKRRRELVRQRRRMEEQLGAPAVARDACGDADAYERFLAIERSGWKGREGGAMATAGDGEFFTEMCGRFARRGLLQLLSLEAGEVTVAMQCTLLASATAFSFKIAYEEQLARFSPGIQLELEFARVFSSEMPGIAITDSCAIPSNEMINRLWPDRRSLQDLALVRPGASGASRAPLLRALGAIRRRRNAPR